MFKKFLLLGSLLTFSSNVFAEDGSVATIKFSPAHNLETMSVGTPLGQGLIGSRFKSLLMIHGYSVVNPMTAVLGSGERPHRLNQAVDVSFGYLVHPRIYLALGIQGLRVDSNNVNFPFLEKNDKNYFLGDINITANVRLTQSQSKVALGLLVNGTIATASKKMLITDGHSIDARLAMSVNLHDTFNLYGNVGYKYSYNSILEAASFQPTTGSSTVLTGLNHKSSLVYGAGFIWSPIKIIGFGAEFFGSVGFPYKKTTEVMVSTNPWYVDAYIKINPLASERLAIFASYGLENLIQKNKPEDRFGLGVRLGLMDLQQKAVAPVAKPMNDLVQRLKVARRVEFVVNKSEIKTSSFDELDKAADAIKMYANQLDTIEIQGHTDNTGARDYNIGLSQKRAEAVKAYLVNKGVPAKILVAKGYGPDMPVSDNKTREGRQSNRRVEFVIDANVRVNK